MTNRVFRIASAFSFILIATAFAEGVREGIWQDIWYFGGVGYWPPYGYLYWPAVVLNAPSALLASQAASFAGTDSMPDAICAYHLQYLIWVLACPVQWWFYAKLCRWLARPAMIAKVTRCFCGMSAVVGCMLAVFAAILWPRPFCCEFDPFFWPVRGFAVSVTLGLPAWLAAGTRVAKADVSSPLAC